jgi:hypothetical protein
MLINFKEESMKRILLVIAVLSLAVLTQQLAFAESAPQEGPAFTVARLVIAGSIEDREPVGIVDAFSSSTEKVYCFLEATDIAEDTTVSFVWYAGDTRMADITLPIKQGARWRTYSSKKLGGLKENWRVELQDAAGQVMKIVEFTVE